MKELPQTTIYELVERLEMAAQRTPKDHGSLQVVLARYSKDMDKQELHTRSHLVHHLRNTGLGEIADK